jgi:hypothetical protein
VNADSTLRCCRSESGEIMKFCRCLPRNSFEISCTICFIEIETFDADFPRSLVDLFVPSAHKNARQTGSGTLASSSLELLLNPEKRSQTMNLLVGLLVVGVFGVEGGRTFELF